MLPLGKPHVMIAFAQPVAIRRISVTGETLKAAELHLTVVDPATCVEQKQDIDLGAKSGKEPEWTLPASLKAAHVNTLKVTAEFDEGASDTTARSLRLRIEFDDPPVRP